MNGIKATPSQLALWHAITALVLSTGTSSGMAIFQYVSAHGVNIGQDVSYGVVVLLSAATLLPVSIYHLVQSSPALPQAEKDTEAQAAPIISTALGQVGSFVKEEINALENRLHIHINNAVQAATPAVPAPYKITDAPTSVSQVPFQAVSGPATFTSYDANVHLTPTASGLTATTPSVMLNTFPMMPAVPKQ